MKGVIFGAGVYGKKILRGLQEIYNVEVVAFCDNDKKKWLRYPDEAVVSVSTVPLCNRA